MTITAFYVIHTVLSNGAAYAAPWSTTTQSLPVDHRCEPQRSYDGKNDEKAEELPLPGLSLPLPVEPDGLPLVVERLLVVFYVLALQVANLLQELDYAFIVHAGHLVGEWLCFRPP